MRTTSCAINLGEFCFQEYDYIFHSNNIFQNITHPRRIQIFDQVYELSSAESNVLHKQNRIELAMKEIRSYEPILECPAEIVMRKNGRQSAFQ